MFVDGAAVSDCVQRDNLASIVLPKEHSIVSQAALAEAGQVRGQIPKWLSMRLGMGREPLNLADDPASDGGVEPLEAALEIGGCLYLIRIDHE